MATTAIRNYLRGKGLKDEEITYDNGTVFAKGRRFMDAKPQADGKTYADAGVLDNTYNAFDARSQLDTLKAKAASPNPLLNNYQQRINTQIDKPPTQFTYDKDKDLGYQSAMSSAALASKTAAGNIAADMNKRGLLNSTITQDRGNQAAAQEYNRVTNEVLPTLINQAYQRYADDRRADEQKTQNMFGMFDRMSLEDQRGFDRQRDALGYSVDMNQNEITNQRNAELDERAKRRDHVQEQQWHVDTYGAPFEAKEDYRLLQEQAKGRLPMAAREFAARRESEDRNYELAKDQYELTKTNSELDNSLAREKFNFETGPKFEYEQAEAGVDRTSKNYNEQLKRIDSVAQFDDDGALANPDTVIDSILLSGLPDWDQYKLYKQYGLQWDDPIPAPPGKGRQ